MPQRFDGPGKPKVKRVKRKPSVGDAVSDAAKKPVSFGPKKTVEEKKVAGKKLGSYPVPKKALKKPNPRTASDPNPNPKTKRQGNLPADAPIGARNPVKVVHDALDTIERLRPKPVTVPRGKQKGALRVATAAAGSPDARILLNAGKDAVDIPANTIPSTYRIGKELAKGRVLKAGKMVAEGTVDALKHPVEHPLAFGLTVSGGYGAVGRGAGKTARVLSKDKVGSVKGRAPARLEGTTSRDDRQYSKNIITKQVQKQHDKSQPAPRMTVHQVTRRVDHTMARNEGVRRVNRSEVADKVDAVVGKHPSSAVPVAAQRIVKPTPGSVERYRKQVESSAKETEAKMKADPKAARDLKAIHRTQKTTAKRLAAAEKKVDSKTAKAADDFAELSVGLQDKLVARKLIDKDQAEKARLIPYAVQRMGAKHDGEQIVKSDGSPLPTAEIRAHMKENGVKEPAFITQAPDQRGAKNYYVAQHGGVVVRSPKRTGEATRKGSFDVHPDTMKESAVRAQGLVDAHDGWNRVLREFGRRKDGDAKKPLAPHKTYRDAKDEAAKLAEDGDGAWVPVKVAPFGVKKEQLNQVFAEADETRTRKLADDMADGIGVDEKGNLRSPKDESGNWILMDKTAAQRLNRHVKMIGRGGADPFSTAYGSLFRGVVLATSPKWLVGNVAEAGLRSAVAHAGPRSYVTGKRWFREVERLDPEYAKLVREEVLGGGVAGMSQRVNKHVSAQSFTEGGKLQKAAQIGGTIKRAPVARWVPEAWSHYTNFVFNVVNRGIERQFQTAMAGKAVRDQLIPEGLVKLSEKAVKEAAEKTLDLNTAVALGRAVDEMYGRYSKFGPTERYWISTYTPFIRWSLNALEFVYKVLPRDHPVLTGLIASSYVASEDWRNDKGLSLFVNDALPGFLQGSIPGEGGSHLRVSRYTPFGAFTDNSSAAGTLANNLLPQYMGIYEAFANGQDWKGKKIEGGLDARAAEAGKQFLGGAIPFFSPLTNIAGNEGDAKAKVRKQVDPFMFTQPKQKVVKRKDPYSSGYGAGGYGASSY